MPVTGKTHFRRRLIQQVEGLALSRSPITRCGRIKVRPIGQCLGKAKPQIVGQCRAISVTGNRAKPLDRVVEGLRTLLARSWIVRVEGRRVGPAPRLRLAIKSRLKPKLPLARQIGVLFEEQIEQLDGFGPVPSPRLRVG